MKLDYYYRETPKIKEYFEKLEVLRRVFDLLPKLPHIEENLRRESLLKSSLFSARIEGNKLKLEDISYASLQRTTKNIERIEVANILKALNWLDSGKIPKKLSFKLILKLHQFVLFGLSPDAGKFRHQPSAIFNQAGIAIYVPPPPNQIPRLVRQLIKRMNLVKEPGPAKAAVCHFVFEKIHPFLDGNGRVGRLLSTFILKNFGFSFRGLASLEEYFEKERQAYYDLLTITAKDITDFVEFFLEGLSLQTEKAIVSLKEIKTEVPEDRLLPRRREILEIVREHQMVSFDFLKRRFLKISESTLHYDLKRLLQAGFIKKLGTTRGAVYTP